MQRRLDGARHDSDVALFYDLLGYGELLTKLVVLALVAAIEDDDRQQRYRFEYHLVRTHSIGTWGAVLHDLVTGRLRSALREEAGAELAELTAGHQRASTAWQAKAVDALSRAATEMDVGMPVLPERLHGWMWFANFPALRNRTRGHGTPRPAPCQRACPALEESMHLIVENLTLFRRPWAAVHRHLSGHPRVVRLGGQLDRDKRVFDLGDVAQGGVYVLFATPRRVPLLECEPDHSDLRVANGAFKEEAGTHELLSYVRDERTTADASPYLTPPTRLPATGPNAEPQPTKSGYLGTVLQALEDHADAAPGGDQLKSKGLALGGVGSELRLRGVTGAAREHGFKNFQAMVQAAVEGSRLCVARPSGPLHPHARLALRAHMPPGLTLLGEEDGAATPGNGRADGQGAQGPDDHSDSVLTDPRLRGQLNGFSKILQADAPDAVAAHAARAVARVLQHPELRRQAQREGVPLGVVAPAVRYAVPDLRPLALGYRNMQPLLVDALSRSELSLAVREGELPPRPRIVLAKSAPPGMRILEPSGDTLAGSPQPHSPALYRRVLGHGLPALRLGDAELVAAVIEWCVTEPPHQRRVAEALDDLAVACDQPRDVVKLPLLALVGANAFVREPSELPLAQQRLTLRQDLRTPEGLLGQLRLVAQEKLQRHLGKVDFRILAAVIGGLPGEATTVAVGEA